MSDIFISYASTDRARAQVLAAALEEHGWSVWWDRTIPPGKTFDEVIEEALDASRSVIVVWSEAAVASQWVRAEAGEGWRRGILIPVLIQDVQLPLAFRQIHAAGLIDWQGDPAHPGFGQLVSALSGLLGKPAPAVAKPAEGRRAEDEEKRKADEEVRLKAEEEKRKRVEVEAKRKAEAEAKQKAEREEKRRAEEEEKKRKAEEEARLRAEEEASKKAEAEKQKRAQAEAKRKAEEEARQKAVLEEERRAEAAAKREAEAEARRVAELEEKAGTPVEAGSGQPAPKPSLWEQIGPAKRLVAALVLLVAGGVWFAGYQISVNQQARLTVEQERQEAAQQAVDAAKQRAEQEQRGTERQAAEEAARRKAEEERLEAERRAADEATTQRERVREAQVLLAKLGYEPGPADGLPGRATAGAVEAFKRMAGLPVNSGIDEGLLVALREAKPATTTFATGDTFKDCPECPEMVVVPAGSFLMGSLDDEEGRNEHEGPQHRVTIPQPFAIGRYEVTYEEWDICTADGGCATVPDGGWRRGRRPVMIVSWLQAQAYVDWLSARTGQLYRLPSEAEWEYAARAGTTTPYAFGDKLTQAQATFSGDNAYEKNHELPTEVGSYPANAWGLHDMHGNLSEWVQDCMNYNYEGAPTDGTAWTTADCKRRVFRGGSFDWVAIHQRSASRNYDEAHDSDFFTGFRVARTLP